MVNQSAGVLDLDPVVPDWAQLSLPDTWPDRLNFRRPKDWWTLLSSILVSPHKRVELPIGMPGADAIPKYVLQEFHNLPNGNYSKKITRGYITGFERLMTAAMADARTELAAKVAGANSVLDIGCAGGRMAAAVCEQGASDVWGLDPSPYLLQHAAQSYPQIQFVQGLAEESGFSDQRFDAITACFVLHEIPPRYLDKALAEFHRVLKPGGLVAVSEPSPQQLKHSLVELVKRWGWRGWYFGVIARVVKEPFIDAWHNQDMASKFAEFGFELIEDKDSLPIRRLIARKTSN